MQVPRRSAARTVIAASETSQGCREKRYAYRSRQSSQAPQMDVEKDQDQLSLLAETCGGWWRIVSAGGKSVT